MKFELYQAGSLRILKRVRGPSLWQFRYRHTTNIGQRKQKSIIVGTTEEYTAATMRHKLQGLLLSINAAASTRRKHVTVSELIDRFIHHEHLLEIGAGKIAGPGMLHYATAKGYLMVLNRYLRPRWGGLELIEVRPYARSKT